MGRVFNKGLDEDDQKEGLLKRLKDIEDKSEEQLKAFKGKTGLKSQIDLFDKDCGFKNFKTLEKLINNKVMTDGKKLLMGLKIKYCHFLRLV